MSEDTKPAPIIGLRHVTAIASNPQRNLDFYTARVAETEAVLKRMGAVVEAVRYVNRPHTVLAEEVAMAQKLIDSSFS